MSFRFGSHSTGPLAQLARAIGLPACLSLDSAERHGLWAIVDPDPPESQRQAFVLAPSGNGPQPDLSLRFQSVNDWLPGMTLLYKRQHVLRGSARGEISALWTSLVSPAKNLLAGDIGLDLDLGLEASAHWEAAAQCWWSLERPRDPGAAVLRLRLAASGSSARNIRVAGDAVAGASKATRQTLAALAGRHRDQLLRKMRQGIWNGMDKLSFLNHVTGLDTQSAAALAESTFHRFLDEWFALDPAEQSRRWNAPADPLLPQLQDALRSLSAFVIDEADHLTARLEHAALQVFEKRCEATLAASFSRAEASETLLDAEFDFAIGNPRLDGMLQSALEGDLNPVLHSTEPGLKLHRCVLSNEINRRQTFSWRMPWTSGEQSAGQRIATAIEALDTELGRTVKGKAHAESALRTRRAASLLTLEASFASLFRDDVVIHNPAVLHARFEMQIPANHPASLQPLLDLYGCGPADPRARECHLRIGVASEALAHWLEPHAPNDVSRRLQCVWRTLLLSVVDFDGLEESSAAPLLVWASLPVTAGARRTSSGIELNRNDDTYWDWRDPNLVEGMVWNPRTRAALEQRLRLAHPLYDADSLRRGLRKPVAKAAFESLLYVEAQMTSRVGGLLNRLAALNDSRRHDPARAMRECSLAMSGLTTTFHKKLTSIYGAGSARALGPLLLSASPGLKPEVSVSWIR